MAESIKEDSSLFPIHLLLRIKLAAVAILLAVQVVAAGQVEGVGAGNRILKDILYGKDPRQRMDVYLPSQAVNAPVIFMVHGGAWRLGDKAAHAVVDNKVARWVHRGFLFISTNYRLLPQIGPVEQATDVAHALRTAQAKVSAWGGDPAKFVLMGHSAGAHLVALVAAAPERALSMGVRPWLGTVLLDSAALDTVKLMKNNHDRLYDHAFGDNLEYWQFASPRNVLTKSAPPFLLVCSVQRLRACDQARSFIDRATSLGVRARLLPQDLTHHDINLNLGTGGDYTLAVESFMAGLDDAVKHLLQRTP